MAKYNKSWGSVSTHFSKTTAPSSAQRMSKAAEDKYQKEMNQLRTMKDVAAFESRQAQTSASMASKAAEYELGALRKFSGKLDTFLNTTGKDMYAKAQAEDLQKHIDKYESSDLKDHEEYEKKREELQKKIAGISENNAQRLELQEQLRKHNLTSPNDIDPAGLSGNEKLAYLTVKSKNTLQNAELNYNNWINDQIASKPPTKIDATWKPKVTNPKTGKAEWEQIEVGAINHPDGKQRLKQLFFEKTMKENPMGGLKNEWKTLILAGPLRRQLSGLQAKDVQNYNKDQARIADEAAEQALFNAITGTGPYAFEPIAGDSKAETDKKRLAHNVALLNGAIQSKRFNYTKYSGQAYHKGMEDLIDNSLNQVLEMTDGPNMLEHYGNLKRLFYETPLPSGPDKGKTMEKAFPDDIKRLEISKKFKDAYDGRSERLANEQINTLTADRGTRLDQIASDIESAKVQAGEGSEAHTAAIEKGKKSLSDWQKNTADTYKDPRVQTYIFSQIDDPQYLAMLNTPADWKAKVDTLRAQYNNVVPLKEVAFMPNKVREDLEADGIRFVRAIPGADDEQQKTATKDAVSNFNRMLRISEKDAGQSETNADSDVMKDLASDFFHNQLQKGMLDEDKTWFEAYTDALVYTEELITQGRTRDEKYKSIQHGPLEGKPNPFYVNPDKTGSAWGNNPALKQHRDNRRLLLPFPEAQYNHAERRVTAINQKGKLDLSRDYIFVPVQFDHTKAPGDAGYINLDSIQQLGITPDANPSRIATEQARRLGIKDVASVRAFVSDQRDALIAETGGLNSPIWQDPVLIEAWDLPNHKKYKDAQATIALKSAPNLPYLK